MNTVNSTRCLCAIKLFETWRIRQAYWMLFIISATLTLHTSDIYIKIKYLNQTNYTFHWHLFPASLEILLCQSFSSVLSNASYSVILNFGVSNLKMIMLISDKVVFLSFFSYFNIAINSENDTCSAQISKIWYYLK